MPCSWEGALPWGWRGETPGEGEARGLFPHSLELLAASSRLLKVWLGKRGGGDSGVASLPVACFLRGAGGPPNSWLLGATVQKRLSPGPVLLVYAGNSVPPGCGCSLFRGGPGDMLGVKGSGRCCVLQCVGSWAVYPPLWVPPGLTGLGLGLGSSLPLAPRPGVPWPFSFTTFPARPVRLWQHWLQQHVFFPVQPWLIAILHGAEVA